MFCVVYFWDRVSKTSCPSWILILILLISASWVARIIGRSHWWLARITFLYIHGSGAQTQGLTRAKQAFNHWYILRPHISSVLKITCLARCMAGVIERLSSKCEALSLNPSTAPPSKKISCLNKEKSWVWSNVIRSSLLLLLFSILFCFLKQGLTV
jgi:hypothetical protein